MERTMTQYAPWPTDLEDAVRELVPAPGERYALRDCIRDEESQGRGVAGGLTFNVYVTRANTYPPFEDRTTRFLFPVPPTTWNRQSWERWIFDRLMDVDRHERMESTVFRVPIDRSIPVDETQDTTFWTEWRPFAPLHGPGDNPHDWVYMASTDEQRRTQWTGEVKAS